MIDRKDTPLFPHFPLRIVGALLVGGIVVAAAASIPLAPYDWGSQIEAAVPTATVVRSPPLSFERDERPGSDGSQYVSYGSGYSLALTGTEAVLRMRSPASTCAGRRAKGKQPTRSSVV
ncbi:MAG TPA: hypothetical protein VK689_17095, partial [Armatimonadota bacterium]|nr:hypothetical protein [Armatimonadota bacterium]